MPDSEKTLVKIEIRQDNEAGLVRATFVGFGEVKEIATLALWIVQDCPEAFQTWKKMLKEAFQRSLDVAGVQHGGFEEVEPGSLN